VAGSYSVIKPPSKLVFSWVIEPPDEHAGFLSLPTLSVWSGHAGQQLPNRRVTKVDPMIVLREFFS